MSDLLQKVVDTTLVGSGSGGILNPAQTNRFIDYFWDETVLGQNVRQVRMNTPVMELDKMDLGTRLARHATEGVDDHVNASPTFSKIQVTTEKIRLDWELTTESLEDNIERDALEDHIARLMAGQLANDLEDLAINGDDSLASTADGYALLKAFDGYKKKSFAGAHSVSANGNFITNKEFNDAFRAMPRKFKTRKNQMKFWTSSNIVQDYYWWLHDQNKANFDISERMLQPGSPGVIPAEKGGQPLSPFGIQLVEVPLQLETFTGSYTTDAAVTPYGESADSDPTQEYHGYIELTHPDNRIWAVKREIKVYREFKARKDAIEYTVYTYQGVQIDHLDAYVVVKDVRTRP